MGSWNFSYDSLNRLVSSQNTATTPTSSQYAGNYGCWSYDAFGNRLSQAISTTPCANNPPLMSWANYNANNQFTNTSQAPGGVQYDPSGDVLNDGSNQYLYDGEGRLCAVLNAAVPSMPIMTGYFYEAAGTRVAKGSLSSFSCNFAANGFTPTASYVLGLNGEQVTELTVSGAAGAYVSAWKHANVFDALGLQATYSQTGSAAAPTSTFFALNDWLGTKRAEVGSIAGSNGAPQPCVATFASLPYGDGLTPSGNCPDATEHHFTGKERDSESGNDYFFARYYLSAMGRFMSPDAPVDQHPDDPQSWNLYSYVRNNPLSLTDPTGDYACGQMTDDQCTGFGKMLTQAQSVLDAANKAGTINSDQYDAATKAIGAYGTLNDGNGVTVNVGATGGNPGNTRADGGGDKTDANPTGQKIDVTLNRNLFSQGSTPDLLGAIAHEGSHVEDAESWAKAGFTPGANPSGFKTENAAYGVTITMAQAQGAKTLTARGTTLFWDSSKSSGENQIMRSSMINRFYPKNNLKVFGENTKGSGYGTK
jgi:RHS repeat-associated protein